MKTCNTIKCILKLLFALLMFSITLNLISIIDLQIYKIEDFNNESTTSIIQTGNIFEILPLIIDSCILAPLMEELIFRKIIFGHLYKKSKNFIFSMLVSSIIFGLAHIPNSEPNKIYPKIIIVIIFGYISAIISRKCFYIFHPDSHIFVEKNVVFIFLTTSLLFFNWIFGIEIVISNLARVYPQILGGIMFCMVYKKTGNLIYCILLHAIWNFLYLYGKI